MTQALAEPLLASVRAVLHSNFKSIVVTVSDSLILVKDTQICVCNCLNVKLADRKRLLSMASAITRPFKRKLLPERLGHEVIDSDHMEISKSWFRAVNCVPLQFPFLIARMQKLMGKHFAHEVEIMGRFNSSLPGCHQREHDALLRFCDNVKSVSQYNWAQAQQLLRRDFPRHVREHIICMDQLLVLCVNTNGDRPCGPYPKWRPARISQMIPLQSNRDIHSYPESGGS